MGHTFLVFFEKISVINIFFINNFQTFIFYILDIFQNILKAILWVFDNFVNTINYIHNKDYLLTTLIKFIIYPVILLYDIFLALLFVICNIIKIGISAIFTPLIPEILINLLNNSVEYCVKLFDFILLMTNNSGKLIIDYIFGPIFNIIDLSFSYIIKNIIINTITVLSVFLKDLVLAFPLMKCILVLNTVDLEIYQI